MFIHCLNAVISTALLIAEIRWAASGAWPRWWMVFIPMGLVVLSNWADVLFSYWTKESWPKIQKEIDRVLEEEEKENDD